MFRFNRIGTCSSPVFLTGITMGSPAVPTGWIARAASIGSQKFVTPDIVANFCVNPILKLETMYRLSAKVGTMRLLQPNLDRYQQYPPRPIAPEAGYRMACDPDRAPSIAIVTPTLNQNRFIAETIASVLAQGYPRLSYAVEDGGSTDGTVATLQRHGDALCWSSAADGGQAEAINRGFARIQGEIMAWLNSDDVLLPGALAYVGDYFTRHPEADMVYGDRIFIDAAGRETGRGVLPRHDPAALIYIDYVPQETLFWRRRVWAAVGPIDGSFRYALDWDFILRAEAAGFDIRHLPRFLGCFRVHDGQKTKTMQAIGLAEMQRLRLRSLGRTPTPREISLGARRYLLRHVARDRAYRLSAAASGAWRAVFARSGA